MRLVVQPSPPDHPSQNDPAPAPPPSAADEPVAAFKDLLRHNDVNRSYDHRLFAKTAFSLSACFVLWMMVFTMVVVVGINLVLDAGLDLAFANSERIRSLLISEFVAFGGFFLLLSIGMSYVNANRQRKFGLQVQERSIACEIDKNAALELGLAAIATIRGARIMKFERAQGYIEAENIAYPAASVIEMRVEEHPETLEMTNVHIKVRPQQQFSKVRFIRFCNPDAHLTSWSAKYTRQIANTLTDFFEFNSDFKHSCLGQHHNEYQRAPHKDLKRLQALGLTLGTAVFSVVAWNLCTTAELPRLRAHANWLNRPKALAHLDAAVARDPLSAISHAERGEILFEMKRFSEAASEFEQTRALGLNHFYYDYCYIESLIRLRRTDEALAFMNTEIASHPNSCGRYALRAIVSSLRGSDSLALSDISTAIRLGPERAFLYTIRGGINLKIGNGDLALANYNKGIVLGDVESRWQRAQLYKLMRRDAQAEADYAICRASGFDPELACYPFTISAVR